MKASDHYSPSRQFLRALRRDWHLHSIDLLAGTLYPLVGFFVGLQVGYSQVYPVIMPFLVSAAFMVYLTRRLCLAEARRASAFCYFNLPQDRLMALDGHVAFLAITIGWMSLWIWLGSLVKLGGAGMTACYRFHPEFAVLPWLVAGLVIRHAYRVRRLAFWLQSLVWYGVLAAWVVWRSIEIMTLRAYEGNDYWPDRGTSLAAEWAWAGVLAGLTVWLICSTRIRWRTRQIGAIQ